MELSNPQYEDFAQFIVAGENMTQAAILAGYKASAASNIGSRLAKLPQVRGRIAELKELHSKKALTAAGIRNPQARISALEDIWTRMRQVITERAEDPEMQSVPGGKTGVLVMTYKTVGAGPSAQIKKEYAFDRALVQELRDHSRQAAEELGQWTTRKEIHSESVTLDIGEVLKQSLATLTPSERARLLEDPNYAETLAKVEAIDIKAVKDEESK
jgi:phage terminase small subunit